MTVAQIESDYDECGTYAGWNKHRLDRTRVCDACKAAQRDYMREYRKKTPQYVVESRTRNAAAGRALWRLAHLHPTQFGALLEEEISTATAPDPTEDEADS